MRSTESVTNRQIQHSLQMQEQRGAIARMRDGKLVDNRPVAAQTNATGLPQFHVQCRWRVAGTVEHWGHIHTREHQYEAMLTVRAQPNHWKITAYDLLDKQRVRFGAGIRTAKGAG